jgi:hypothetical protein
MKRVYPKQSVMSSTPSSSNSSNHVMPPRYRSRGRTVDIHDAKDCDTALGSLILTNGITNTNLYSTVEIYVIFTRNSPYPYQFLAMFRGKV